MKEANHAIPSGEIIMKSKTYNSMLNPIRLFIVLLVFLLASVVVNLAMAAGEIQTTLKVNVKKGLLKKDISPDRSTSDMSGNNVSDATQTFTSDSTNQVLIAASVLTNGIAVIEALWTNKSEYIDFGPGGASVTGDLWKFARLAGSEKILVRLNPTNKIYGACGSISTNTARMIVIEN